MEEEESSIQVLLTAHTHTHTHNGEESEIKNVEEGGEGKKTLDFAVGSQGQILQCAL